MATTSARPAAQTRSDPAGSEQVSVSGAESGPLDKGQIVVGLDGSVTAEHALRWAMREADLHRTDVQAVLAWAAAGPARDGSNPPPATSPEHPRWTAHCLLYDTADRVRRDEPSVRLTTRAAFGPAVRVLLAAAEGEQMLVVGGRGSPPSTPMLVGSVSLACAHGATVPVVVVHGDTSVWEADRPVVVGVDGSAVQGLASRQWKITVGFVDGGICRPILAPQR